MADIDVYSEYNNYMKFQNLRPDYVRAIDFSIRSAEKYAKSSSGVVIADFCCGTGSNAKKIADNFNGIKKAILVDINKGFLDIAKKSGIKTEKLEIQNNDILKASFNRECDLVFSIFAYHHVRDEDKIIYINQIKNALKKGGIVVLTEIYFGNKEECLRYYKELFESIDKNKVISGLKEFLEQTANSHEFEFKVSKKFADDQFINAGFKKLAEEQIYPTNGSFGNEQGTFVQVYQL